MEMIQGFIKNLLNEIEKVKPMEHPNKNHLRPGDINLGTLEDSLARKLWTLKEDRRRSTLNDYLDQKEKRAAIFLMEYNIYRLLFLYRMAEVMNLFGKENIWLRSNWEVVTTPPSPPRFILFG